MSYHSRIQMLSESLALLESEILSANCTATKLNELNERKSQYQSEIRRLTRLQWEEDHERVNFEDDR